MKKNYLITLVLFYVNICFAQKKPTKPIPKQTVQYRTACDKDNIISLKNKDHWKANNYNQKTGYYNLKDAKSIYTIKKEYSIQNGLLFFKNKIVSNLEIYFGADDGVSYNVGIMSGLPISQNIIVTNNPYPSMYGISYSKGNIRYNYINHTINLLKGNGMLKIYYYSLWDAKKQAFSKEILKEEGEVKNNFKFGEWKYYNKEGKIDSLKTYTLKDSVDVRFPHCIFNKNEPCY